MNTETGNLVEVKEGIIVHGCNAQGKMASGVAKDIRAKFPQAYQKYMQAYEEKGLRVGQVVWALITEDPKLAVANGITQKFYGRNPSVRYVDYEGVRQVFRQVGEVARRRALPVHYPKIGAGLGNGDWTIIEKIINEELHGVQHTLWLPPTPGASLRRSP